MIKIEQNHYLEKMTDNYNPALQEKDPFKVADSIKDSYTILERYIKKEDIIFYSDIATRQLESRTEPVELHYDIETDVVYSKRTGEQDFTEDKTRTDELRFYRTIANERLKGIDSAESPSEAVSSIDKILSVMNLSDTIEPTYTQKPKTNYTN